MVKRNLMGRARRFTEMVVVVVFSQNIYDRQRSPSNRNSPQSSDRSTIPPKCPRKPSAKTDHVVRIEISWQFPTRRNLVQLTAQSVVGILSIVLRFW
jgi:hypothetical protein